MLAQGPAWALPPEHQPGMPKTRARMATCSEGQPLRLCALSTFHSQERGPSPWGSVLFPTLPGSQ